METLAQTYLGAMRRCPSLWPGAHQNDYGNKDLVETRPIYVDSLD